MKHKINFSQHLQVMSSRNTIKTLWRKLPIFLGFFLLAQEVQAQTTLSPSIAYVSENHIENMGMAIGLTVSKPIYKRFLIDLGATYFSTGIIDLNTNKIMFKGEQRYYHSFFITPSVGYRIVGKQDSRFSVKFSVGPSIWYYSYKEFNSGKFTIYLDNDGNVQDIVPKSDIIYSQDKGVNISLYGGLSIESKITERFKLGAFLDTYSSENTGLEHLMPGIHASFKLGSKR